jgi:hypothetical protein
MLAGREQMMQARALGARPLVERVRGDQTASLAQRLARVTTRSALGTRVEVDAFFRLRRRPAELHGDEQTLRAFGDQRGRDVGRSDGPSRCDLTSKGRVKLFRDLAGRIFDLVASTHSRLSLTPKSLDGRLSHGIIAGG